MRGMGNPSINASIHEYPPAIPLPSAAAQRAERLAKGRVVIVSGAADYGDPDRVFAALGLAHARKPITLLVHGASFDRKTGELLGVDRWAEEWALVVDVKMEPHPADWRTWGLAADAIRCRQMVNAGAHGVVALPGVDRSAAARCMVPVWRPFG